MAVRMEPNNNNNNNTNSKEEAERRSRLGIRVAVVLFVPLLTLTALSGRNSWTMVKDSFSALKDVQATELFEFLAEEESPTNARRSIAPQKILEEAPLPPNRERKDYLKDNKLWYFEKAAPPERFAKTYYLSSVPHTKHRLESSAYENITEYMANTSMTYPHKDYLFEINPSIVQLPKEYQRIIKNGETAYYIASYRVTRRHDCFPKKETNQSIGGWETFNSRPMSDHVGIGLLGRNYEILADTVVTLKSIGVKNSDGHEGWIDYRIFNLHDTLYLTYNQEITPLYLTFQPDASPPKPTKGKCIKMAQVFDRSIFDVWVRDYVTHMGVYGKNLLYFADGNYTYLIIQPEPFSVKNVDLDFAGRGYSKNDTRESFQMEKPLPVPSFKFGLKGLDLTTDRGSACCVTIEHPKTREKYFVGVSHQKQRRKGVLPQRTYLSRFFAFEKSKPYSVMARSGPFCLGFPSSEEREIYIGFKNYARMRFNGTNRIKNCPKVHFVAGITENIFDDSKIILAYGVKDCLSRFTEYDKIDIANMLWPQVDEKEDIK